MDEREYEEWRAAEADYKAQRRKRVKSSSTRKEAGYLWDQSDPIIKFESLIPRWQNIVVAFLTAVRHDGVGPEEAWLRSRGSVRRQWMELDRDFRASLTHLWKQG